ncbi:Thioredoxin [uncultured virus]|nr:Thioredoxin [uncultured virus]
MANNTTSTGTTTASPSSSKNTKRNIIIAVVAILAILLIGLFIYWLVTLFRTEPFKLANGSRKDKVKQRIQNNQFPSQPIQPTRPASTTRPYLNQSNVSDAATAATTPLFTLYNFSKPTCPYCRKFEPTWSELASGLSSSPSDLRSSVARTSGLGSPSDLRAELIDISKPENEALAFYFNVEGVPTIILVTPDQIIEYSGNRSLEDLHNFVVTHLNAYRGAQTPSSV